MISFYLTILNRVKFIFVFTLLFCLSISAQAQNIFSGTGNWTETARWSLGTVPTSGTAVQFASGANCTINTAAVCASVTFNVNSANTLVTISSGQSLTVSGAITFNDPSSASLSQILDIADGTASFTNVSMANTNASTEKNILRINNGTATMSGTFTTSGGAGENEVQFTGTGKLIYTNSTTIGLDNNELVEGAGTIEFGRSGNQTIAAITYNNIIFSGSGTKTMANATIDTITVNSGVTVSWGGVTTTVNGLLTNNATININNTTGTKIFVGKVVNNGTWNNSANEAIEFRGGIENNGTFTPGTATQTFTTNTQDFSGTNPIIFTNSITINSPAVINNYDSVQVAGTFTLNAGATWRNQANSQLRITGSASISGTMNCDGDNNTVYFDRAGTQTSPTGAVYHHLSKTTSNTLTLGNTTINGRLLINSGTISMGANTVTVGSSINGSGTITQSAGGVLNIGGDNNHTGTHTVSTGTVNYNGNNDQIVRALTYNNLGIDGSNIKSMSGNVTVSGTLTLTAGTLNINGNLLTLNGALSTTSGNIRGSSTSDLIIGGTAAAAAISMDQTSSPSRTLERFILNRSNGASFSNAVEIIDSIGITTGTLTTGGNITLISTSSQTARIGRINGGITGNITAQRFIPGGTGKRKWRFLSSPVNVGGTGINLTQYIDDTHVTGVGGSANGFDDCTCLPSIRYYDETYNQVADSGWTNPLNINHVVNTGTAVEVFVRGSRNVADPFLNWSVPDDATIDFIGETNKDDITVNLSYTNTGRPTADGFNLIGNPYPSQIDWLSTAWTKTNIDNFFWSYDPDATDPKYGGYNPVSDLAYNGASQYIPSGMGFFVRATSAGASITFRENIKSTSSPYNFFKSYASSSKYPFIRLECMDSTLADEALIVFDSNAVELSTDPGDMIKLFNKSLNFYSKSKEGRNLTMNNKPFPVGSKIDTVRLSMFAFEDSLVRNGNYTIYLKEKINVPNIYSVDLFDKLLNQKINILVNSYTFNVNSSVANSWGNNRFELHIYKNASNTNNSFNNSSIKIYPNPSNENLFIQQEKNNIINIELYNQTGQLIDTFTSNKLITKINTISLANGIYYLKIIQDNQIQNHKILITH